MATQELTFDRFEEILEAGGITLVCFWAKWCEPSRTFSPVFEASSEKHSDIQFLKCDIEDERELSALLNVMTIPTILTFRDGILVFSEARALPGAALEQLIAAMRGLDMDELRLQLAEHETSETEQ
jgi:thioredoxin 1